MAEITTTSESSKLYETTKYRCLVYSNRITDDIYLRLCGVEHCMPDYRFDAGTRTGYHLHIILEGKGTLCVNGVEHKLHFGQMFVTKPGEEAWYKADSEDPWVYCWMAFDGNIAGGCVERAGFFDGVNCLDCYVDQQNFYAIVQQTLSQPEEHVVLLAQTATLGENPVGDAAVAHLTVTEWSQTQDDGHLLLLADLKEPA